MNSALSRRHFLSLGAWAGGLASCSHTRRLAFPGAPRSGSAGLTTPFYADVHCHTFNARDIPIDGFLRSLAQGEGMPAIFDGALALITRPFHEALIRMTPPDEGSGFEPSTAVLAGAKATAEGLLIALAQFLQQSDKLGTIKADSVVAVAKTLLSITRPREELAEAVARAYPRVQLFTPALVDFEHWIERDKTGPVLGADTRPWRQIELHDRAMRRVSARLGVRFHPFAPFNPLRQVLEGDARDRDGKPTPAFGHTPHALVRDAVLNRGFIGVKLYPASGFLPLGNDRLEEFQAGGLGRRLDSALRELYQFCLANDVPILTHASAGNSFFRNSSWRGSPWAWRQVLDEYPGLRLCFAHFGHLQGMEGVSETVKCTSWAEGYLDLMQRHQHVYADISNTDAAQRDQAGREAYQIRFLSWLCARLSQQNGTGLKLARRLIYGSDWWMGMVTGDDNHYFDNIHDMIEHPMKPVCDALKRVGIDFPGDFFGENGLRFLGIRDDEGRLRGQGNGQRLSSFQRNLGGPTPRWLQPSA